MIYVTGDVHLEEITRFFPDVFPKQTEMTKNDYVIILGDFGLIWDYRGESETERLCKDFFNNRNFTTLFIDGNHENYERLAEYPVEEWKGGRIQIITPSIYHLMRGQVYEIDGLRIFTFGGAKSHDISGGLFKRNDPELEDKINNAMDAGLPFRIDGMSWWKEELPTEEEMKEGIKNLKKHDFKVDYILTHCTATSIQKKMNAEPLYMPDVLTDYFDNLREKSTFKKWYFGHYHYNAKITDKDMLLYEMIVPLE